MIHKWKVFHLTLGELEEKLPEIEKEGWEIFSVLFREHFLGSVNGKKIDLSEVNVITKKGVSDGKSKNSK